MASGAGYGSSDIYSVMTPYTQIGPVHSALSFFTAQIIEDQLLAKAETSVHEKNGQHASVTSKIEDRSVQWTDIGAMLIPTVKIMLETHQLLAFHYMWRIAESKPHWCHGICVV